MSDTLNPTEAIYGFVGWLTCREEETLMGASHDCTPIVGLIEKFCKNNNLPNVSKDWPNNLIHDESGEVAVPGIGHNKTIQESKESS